MRPGFTEILIILAIAGFNVLPLWGSIDAALIGEPAWQAAGKNRLLWVVLQLGGLFLCGIGIVAAGIYFLSIRPTVKRAQRELQ